MERAQPLDELREPVHRFSRLRLLALRACGPRLRTKLVQTDQCSDAVRNPNELGAPCAQLRSCPAATRSFPRRSSHQSHDEARTSPTTKLAPVPRRSSHQSHGEARTNPTAKLAPIPRRKLVTNPPLPCRGEGRGEGTSRTPELALQPSTKLVFLLQGSRGSGSWPLALTSSNGCDRTYSSRPRAGRGGRRRRVSSRPGPAVGFGGCGVAYRSKPACPTSPSCREHVGAAKASEPHGGWPYRARGGDDLPPRSRPPPAASKPPPEGRRHPRPILLSPRGGSGAAPRSQTASPTSTSLCRTCGIGTRFVDPPLRPPPLRGEEPSLEPPLGVRGQPHESGGPGCGGPSRTTGLAFHPFNFQARVSSSGIERIGLVAVSTSPPATVATEPTPAVRERGGGRRRRVGSRPGPAAGFGGCGGAFPRIETSLPSFAKLSREHVGAAMLSEPHGGWPYCARGGGRKPPRLAYNHLPQRSTPPSRARTYPRPISL